MDRGQYDRGWTDGDGSQSGLSDLEPALVELAEGLARRIQAGESIDIDQLCAKHPAWAASIRRLLPAIQGLAELGQAAGDDALASPERLPAAEIDRVFGDFRIVRQIGRGGMGLVYEAEQLPLRRRVALKMLPPTATIDPRALQRFQLEVHVAGLLQHPRIVPVYAVGTVDDVPYYAMQYVEGASLADLIAELRRLVEVRCGGNAREDHDNVAASDRSLSPPSQGGENGATAWSSLAVGVLSGRFAPAWLGSDSDLHRAGSLPVPEVPSSTTNLSIHNRAYIRTIARLGIQAAEALGYAHDQGIVHRDVKPANLLLDRQGELWVADFGMADVQGDAGLTLTGDLPGTLRYMSPEQALGKRALVDRRTDLYALGATLYELLTLQPAVAGTDKLEILRRVAEEEPAPLRRLNPAVPIDLATIVTKALAKDPSSRYETAWQMEADLGRFLEGRPIAARPVGPLSRTWRWCRRKPVQAGLAAALLLALVFGIAGIAWNWRDAVQQKRLLLVARQQALHERDQKEAQRALAEAAEKNAHQQAAKADAINRFLIDKLLLQAAPEHNPNARGVTLREALDRAANEVAASFKDQTQTEAAIRLALGQTYHELGDYPTSEAHLRRAYEILRGRPGDPSLDRLQVTTELGHILYHLGRLAEAERLLISVVDESRRTLGASHDLSLLSARYLATTQREQGQLDAAEALLRRVLEESRRSQGLKRTETLNAMNDLGFLLQRIGKNAEAERLFRECLELKREVMGPQHPDTLTTLSNLGVLLNLLGRSDEAETALRQSFELRQRVLGSDHPATLVSASNLGEVLRTQGRLAEAERLLRPCLKSLRRILGPKHLQTLATAQRLDAVLKARGPSRRIP